MHGASGSCTLLNILLSYFSLARYKKAKYSHFSQQLVVKYFIQGQNANDSRVVISVTLQSFEIKPATLSQQLRTVPASYLHMPNVQTYSLRAQFISKQSAAIITLSPPPSAVTGFWLLSAGIISGMCHSLFTGASSDNVCGYKNNTLHQMLLNRSTLKEEPRCTFRPQIKHLA